MARKTDFLDDDNRQTPKRTKKIWFIAAGSAVFGSESKSLNVVFFMRGITHRSATRRRRKESSRDFPMHSLNSQVVNLICLSPCQVGILFHFSLRPFFCVCKRWRCQTAYVCIGGEVDFADSIFVLIFFLRSNLSRSFEYNSFNDPLLVSGTSENVNECPLTKHSYWHLGEHNASIIEGVNEKKNHNNRSDR